MENKKEFFEPILTVITFCGANGIVTTSRTPVEPISDGGAFEW